MSSVTVTDLIVHGVHVYGTTYRTTIYVFDLVIVYIYIYLTMSANAQPINVNLLSTMGSCVSEYETLSFLFFSFAFKQSNIHCKRLTALLFKH